MDPWGVCCSTIHTNTHRQGPSSPYADPRTLRATWGPAEDARGSQMACMQQEQTSLKCLTPPCEVKNRQFYARKKKQRLTGLACSQQRSVRTHDKPGFIHHLANTTARIQAGVTGVMQTSLVPTSFVAYFFTPIKDNPEKWGHRIPLRVCGRKQAVLKTTATTSTKSLTE